MNNNVEALLEKFPVALTDVEGFTLTRKYQKLKNEIDSFPIFDDDIWICTFPKSGTTWLQEMVWMICNNLDFEKGKEVLDARSPYIDFSVIIYYPEEVKKDPNFDQPIFRVDSIGFAKNVPNPRIIKTHLPYNLLPKEIKTGSKRPKILYVTRDPKDICVSYYHHQKLIKYFNGSFDEFCELFLAGKLLYAPYWNHVFSYWNMKNSQNFLFLRYEDMKKDLKQVIAKVAKFLKGPLDDKQIDILSKHLSFESMQKNSSVNREKILKIETTDGKFMRKGIVGDYNNLMSEEYVKKFNFWISDNTKNTTYTV